MGWTNEAAANAAVAQQITTSESTTSVPIVNLATPGPSATVRVGVTGIVLVSIDFQPAGSTATANPQMWVIMSGANTGAVNSSPLSYFGSDPNFSTSAKTYILTGLTPGLTTFMAQYNNGSGAGTAFFSNRNLGAVAL